ncbi:thioredoxin domain-containing protein [Carboxylicivirga sp. N1Y90]|uniref:thioredoxin domain-containing protein n=1 Tax=Carboxylicivirga fragile TaxID=3417571 RepID=UPI003D3483E6|nr:redoxin domain-containing protein [Marinilabiliaceae bacterium N1Y90]
MKKFVLILVIIFGVNTLFLKAQQPSVVKADELVKRIESPSDTLYIVNFWATWCAPCVEELPVFESSIYKSDDTIIKILLVSLDFKQAYPSLDLFLSKHNITEDVLWLNEKNPNTWVDKIDKSWSGAIPATKLYYGSKQLFHEGQISIDQLQKMINNLK